MFACLPDQDVNNVEERDAAKDKVSPLVTGGDQSSDQTSNDHDLVDENDEENAWPRHGRSQHQIGQEQRCSDDPGGACQ